MDKDLLMWFALVGYKALTLLVGLAFGHMGYRLFLADKIGSAGDLEGKWANYSLSLKAGAPGVFFSLFGTIIIAITLLKGLNYDGSGQKQIAQPVVQVIPEVPLPLKQQ